MMSGARPGASWWVAERLTNGTKGIRMTSSTAGAGSWNQMVIEQFREGRARIGDRFDRSSLLLLHTVGARSGQPRVSPLAYLTIDGEIVVVASAAGADTHPAWYFNLVARPEVTLERWTDDALETLTVRAEVLEDEAREPLWARVSELAPGFAEYQKHTERTIPVVVLHRT
jgi:deazaflavin-dependent oxidoreductase (nitroreductase family)